MCSGAEVVFGTATQDAMLQRAILMSFSVPFCAGLTCFALGANTFGAAYMVASSTVLPFMTVRSANDSLARTWIWMTVAECTIIVALTGGVASPVLSCFYISTLFSFFVRDCHRVRAVAVCPAALC